jgi:hypothetical protein
MTITLHWWALPVAVMLISIFIAWISDDGGSFNFLPGLIVIAGFIASACIVIGHFA